ncbi:MAG: hypothetical protein JST82_08210 [Bacteroidetes bacterium]|nr:hypothetical protein [Bacteroidota bacterium]
MAKNFTKRIVYNKETKLAVIIPQHRKDGMYYEVNINGLARFYMKWGNADRYDLVKEEGITIPYEIVMAVSDAIEKEEQ